VSSISEGLCIVAWQGAELPLSLCHRPGCLGVLQVALAVLRAAAVFPGKWDARFGGVTSSDASNPSPQVNRALLWGPTSKKDLFCGKVRSAQCCCSYSCCLSQPRNVLVFQWRWIWPDASSSSSCRGVREQL